MHCKCAAFATELTTIYWTNNISLHFYGVTKKFIASIAISNWKPKAYSINAYTQIYTLLRQVQNYNGCHRLYMPCETAT